MYARIIQSNGFKCLVWSVVLICLCLWHICGPTLAFAKPGKAITEPTLSATTGDYYRYSPTQVFKLTTKFQDVTLNNAANPQTYIAMNWSPLQITIRVATSSSSFRQISFNLVSVSVAEYDNAIAYYNDTDGDGLFDSLDPCSNSTDSNFTVYRTKNRCTGGYYFFQITGSCGNTKTYHSPEYANISDAYNAAKNAPPECFSAVRDTDRIAMSLDELKNFWDSRGDSANGTGELPSKDLISSDPTGGNNTSSVPPKEVDASDPDNQKIINQLERLKIGIEDSIHSTSEKVRSQVQISGNAIVDAIKGLGGTDHGVANAVGSASNVAHADSQALGEKLDSIAEKIGTPQNATFGGMSKSEMDQSLELNRQETYKVESGAFDSIESSQQGLFDKITIRTNELKNRITSLVPDMSVETSQSSGCVPASSSTVSGFTIQFPEICLTPWESYFVMLGNLLYSVSCIGCIFSIFGFRG